MGLTAQAGWYLGHVCGIVRVTFADGTDCPLIRIYCGAGCV